MLRFLLLIAASIAVIIGVVLGYGVSLPREHLATSRIVLAQPIEAVWEVVRNPAALIGTWPELTRAEQVRDTSGLETWEQTVDGFEIRFRITDARPPTRMVTTIVAEANDPFGGTWTYQMASVADGTQVTLTEAGWIRNPLFRVMGRIFGLHGSVEGYLKALGVYFGEIVRPERLGVEP